MHVRKSVVQGRKPQKRKRREIATWESFPGRRLWWGRGKALAFSLSTISDTQVEMPSLLILVVSNPGEDSVPVYLHHDEPHYTEVGNGNIYLPEEEARLSSLHLQDV